LVSSPAVSQNAAQFGSSARAPSKNSGVCSEASCSSALASQISATPDHRGGAVSPGSGMRASIM